ncbi:Pls/PosA family non-ribosomal peptide synthetase [Micrococcus sp. FDAARGOS_333]|uniref:Pls/PosA family non-ribosomal peptide synthetase n=1 Tax=Micrococcus sp. FDAARGOS_333 TaxID=1930558 RepID=UPI000B4E4695|nr:Pls/PosA family non-ribosomal peptide synthetase [Micrococcus sp. FDAARGOS_333]PNL18241.1 amino acid adenylation protein [Micrococcus sp. FDAARGOS_333]
MVTAPHRAQLPGGDRAPAPRTLWDVLTATAAEHPNAPALDDGTQVLEYTDLVERAEACAARLAAAGIGAGERIGVRIPSGTVDLYVAILGVLAAGCAYVPVDADDPDERARLVFAEAKVTGVLTDEHTLERGTDAAADAEPVTAVGADGQTTATAPPRQARHPLPDDDAWIIFTSGSTGTPKGVAVTHRNAAAFVDAEARIFLADDPLGPGDRVLAGLSVAFDASCEEMWLAWRHGACLVPAPRALVRSGMDLGPWLAERRITAVSTVPTLAAMWPSEALENVRLLIFGGEACPPELAARLTEQGRQVWNTYGPTEATVVACAAEMTGEGPVRIGLPLDGWDLAVVDPATGIPVADGETGELIIGGVGLARYLDPAKDAEKYAPMDTLGWERAYRSGDLVVFDPAGLLFVGRADDQVKLGGRRIELGEVDAALQALPGVQGGAAAVQTTPAGHQILVGYLVPSGAPEDLDLEAARQLLAEELPAALVPRLAVTDTLPTKTSGKVDRNALPWPLPGAQPDEDAPPIDESTDAGWIERQWADVLGAAPRGPKTDFFAAGGGSLAAAQLVARLRSRYPQVTVQDIYATPRIGDLVESLAGAAAAVPVEDRHVARTRKKAQWAQTLVGVPVFILPALRAAVWTALVLNVLAATGLAPAVPTVDWWLLAVAWLAVVSPPGRMALAALACRLLLAGVKPGVHPRGGRVHLRLWLAQHVVDLVDPYSLAGAVWVPAFARVLGARIGKDVDLHSLPPVTGLLEIGEGASIEPEVDLSGYWVDGDRVHIGTVKVGAGAVVGARSTLMPGSSVGEGAHVEPGSTVVGRLRGHRVHAGSPAVRVGKVKDTGPNVAPPRATGYRLLSTLASSVLAALPFIAAAVAGALGLWSLTWWGTEVTDLGPAGSVVVVLGRLLAVSPLLAAVWFGVHMLLVLVTTRLLSIGITEGYHPARSRVGWQIWATERLLDAARDQLFPIYASRFTPTWLRWLGAEVGRDVEASTVVLLPSMTRVGDGAFLADDTMVSSYELQDGWMHVARAKVGKRSFVGNSGMVPAGRTLRRDSLVAVLSTTPTKTKAGTSWMGSPPVRLRRTEVQADTSLTYDPPAALRRARTCWELLRAIPVWLHAALHLLVGGALALLATASWWLTAVAGGLVLLAAGAAAATVTVLAKKVFVGRIDAGEHPLWSPFIWRNEVADTFTEYLAAPWFARAAAGTPAMVWFLRAMGARIGHGCWVESYWLPEADLVSLGDGATVNRGCVVQTHLFHDRVMSLDAVDLAAGATLGPNSVVLPAARLGAGTTVGAGSLVMRGEELPAGTWWIGNPVSPWSDPAPRAWRAAWRSPDSRPRKAS